MSERNHKIAIRVEQVSKCYHIYNKPSDRILQALRPNKSRYREFWALRDINFELEKGKTLGIIGKNGSGKSTLLQILCQTIRPTTGHVITQGRIGALLELGSGFNPEFTGLENIFLNAALLGIRKQEVQASLDKILAFADIGDFVRQPVKLYSSGMAMRLAFAVQTNLKPDVLIIDEALAVGDEMFQKKCYAHIERMKEQGTSILLVTHSCPQIVQHCDSTLLLHRGSQRLIGTPRDVTIVYQRVSRVPDAQWDEVIAGTLRRLHRADDSSKYNDLQTEPGNVQSLPDVGTSESEAYLDASLISKSSVVYPDEGARIEQVTVTDNRGCIVNTLPCGTDFSIQVVYFFDEAVTDVNFACHISGHTGMKITGQRYPAVGECSGTFEATSELSITYRFSGSLRPGTYFVGGSIWQEGPDEGLRYLHRIIDYKAIRIYDHGKRFSFGICDLSLGRPQPLRAS
ncbi:ABC transporter ATP-binding protein [Synechococcus sp. 1G10]|uniref:ABC transporter ATP-binding protein n=1 Tax=Synechococcus sp. 1G10 TaxID=2025605 RepID=UPI000B98FFFF|nr:ABC transporter ATP-binding protein [Synechococcus sp. 1G10]